jgi:hypothetical protein
MRCEHFRRNSFLLAYLWDLIRVVCAEDLARVDGFQRGQLLQLLLCFRLTQFYITLYTI